MDTQPSASAKVAPPTPPSGLGPSLSPLPDIAMAWPRCAQLAAAFLLGAAAALVGGHCLSSLRAGTQPAALDGPQTLAYRVELNTATRGELLHLPGIGPALAERIEEYRRVHGCFANVDELLKVSGIGPTKLEQLRPLVYVRPQKPATGQEVVTSKPALPVVAKSSASKTAKKEAGLEGPIDVNTASLAQLQQLPGIGPKKAQNIVEQRAKKLFTSVDDLRRVSGIGPKTLENLRPHVTVSQVTAQVSPAK
jgi:comEA protein